MTVQSEARRNGRGCGWRGLACAGCLGAVLLAAVIFILFLLFAGSLAGPPAWERLPRSTLWAAEVRDSGDFLLRVSRDKAAMRLLDEWIQNSDAQLRHDWETFAASATEWNERLRFAGSYLFPASILIGGLGKEGGDLFCLLRLPAWQRWLFTGWALFTSGRYASVPESGFYAVQHDGWLFLAETEATLDELVRAWGEKADVFGPGPDGSGPFAQMALRTAPDSALDKGPAAKSTAKSSANNPPPVAPMPLMLSDPFASGGAGGGDAFGTPKTDDAATVRLLLTPTGDAWRLDGAIRFGRGTPPRFAAALENGDRNNTRGTQGEGGATALPAGCDLSAFVSASPALAEAKKRELLSLLLPAASPTASAAPPWKRLGLAWLKQGWLEQASGDFFLLAAPPPPSDDDGEEGAILPVFSLGWLWKPSLPPEQAAAAFADSLTAFLAALTSPDAPPPMPALGRHIVAFGSELGEGMGKGGMIDLPAVLANGIRPSWYVSWNPAFPGGWLAGDAAGLPSARRAKELCRAAPEGDNGGRRAQAGAAWNLSAAFRDALFGVLRERIDTIPEEMLPDRNKWLHNVDVAERALRAYPTGDAALRYVAEEECVWFNGTVRGAE